MINSHQSQLMQDRFGLRVSARLSGSTGDLSHDVSERLRAARVRALSRRKVVLVRNIAINTTLSGGAATLTFNDQEHLSWWSRVAAVVPLLVLVIGLIVINTAQDDRWADELAEVDAALLTDDLPPMAYADPGFMQFIKMSANKHQ